MLHRLSRYGLVLAVLLTIVLGQPIRGEAQCNVTNTTGDVGANIYRSKQVSNATLCTLTMFMNVVACDPGGILP